MYTYHYLAPEKQWGVFKDGAFIAMFETSIEANNYCMRHNDKAQ